MGLASHDPFFMDSYDPGIIKCCGRGGVCDYMPYQRYMDSRSFDMSSSGLCSAREHSPFRDMRDVRLHRMLNQPGQNFPDQGMCRRKGISLSPGDNSFDESANSIGSPISPTVTVDDLTCGVGSNSSEKNRSILQPDSCCDLKNGISCSILLNSNAENISSKRHSQVSNSLSDDPNIYGCCTGTSNDSMNVYVNCDITQFGSIEPHVSDKYDPIVNNKSRTRGGQQAIPTEKGSRVSFFNSTVQVAQIYSMDRSKKYMLQIYPKIDRGFFIAENEWTCYRRNYFQVSASFSAKDCNGEIIRLPFLVDINDEVRAATGFKIGISARLSNCNKTISIIQHTPKRDRDPLLMPRPMNVCVGGNVNQYLANSDRSTVTFERLQFKTATANNGKRRAAQQYYLLVIELLAQFEKNQPLILVAYAESAPLVVRGRSPGHYLDNTAVKSIVCTDRHGAQGGSGEKATKGLRVSTPLHYL